jgi:hypothetical protein
MIKDDARQVVAAVGEVVAKTGNEALSDYPRHSLEVIALYDRCRGLFNAVRLLTHHGLGREALILTRPLFTESLMLLELASIDDTRCVELTIGWSLASLDDLEGIMREAQSRGHDCSEELDAIAKRRKQTEAYARRHGARTRRWKVDEKTLADRHRGGDGYLDFRMSHHFVHGSAFAGEQRVSRVREAAVVGAPSADRDWAEGAALSAAQSMLHAVRGVCGTVGWVEPPGIDDLLARLDRFALERQPA